MRDPYAFNLGHTIHFSDTPQRLMHGDFRVILQGGKTIGDVVRVSIDRPLRLGLTASDFAVQWHRNGKAIPWENERSYRIRPEDIGQKIGCWVTDSASLSSELIGVE